MKPETVHLLLNLEDGSVGVMTFVTVQQRHGDDPGWSRDASDANIEAEIRKTVWSEGNRPVSWRRIDSSEIPQDRTYRAAWRDNGRTIHHDMDKAREIHVGRLRRARGRLLEEKDRNWMRAVGQNNQAAAKAIEDQRQALRDLPQRIQDALAAAATPDEIKPIGWDLLV